jgi:DNA-binding MarR family transcriptional regulator
MKLEEALKTTRFQNETHKVTLNILYTAYWLKTNVSQWLKDSDLTSEQFNVLRILKGKDPEAMCVRDIASRMIEKSSNVPRIIDRLVAKNLVKRFPSTEDKRETLMELTDFGKETLLKANETLEQHTEGMIHMEEEDARMLNELLEKLRASQTDNFLKHNNTNNGNH